MDSELSDDNSGSDCSEIWNDDIKGTESECETWNFRLGLLFYGE